MGQVVLLTKTTNSFFVGESLLVFNRSTFPKVENQQEGILPARNHGDCFSAAFFFFLLNMQLLCLQNDCYTSAKGELLTYIKVAYLSFENHQQIQIK